VFAHGVGSSEFPIDEYHRYAMEFDCVCFTIDYGMDPKITPDFESDFIQAVDYIHEHAEKYGINKNQICIGGTGGGI